MSRIRERIPRELFQQVFEPLVRSIGCRTVILRLNQAARIAIPRQTKLSQLMPKLEILCYEQSRPKVEEELDCLWNLTFDDRLGESEGRFLNLTDELNRYLDGEHLPQEEEQREKVRKVMGDIAAFLQESGFAPEEVEVVFRLKAYPEVLGLFLEQQKEDRTTS